MRERVEKRNVGYVRKEKLIRGGERSRKIENKRVEENIRREKRK